MSAFRKKHHQNKQTKNNGYPARTKLFFVVVVAFLIL